MRGSLENAVAVRLSDQQLRLDARRRRALFEFNLAQQRAARAEEARHVHPDPIIAQSAGALTLSVKTLVPLNAVTAQGVAALAVGAGPHLAPSSTSAQSSASLVSINRYPGAVLVDAPVGYWRLNEASGTTAFDSSGNGLNGTYSGATLGQAGLITGDSSTSSLSFPAQMNVPDSPALRLGSGPMSIELWLKFNTSIGGDTTLWSNSAVCLQVVAGGVSGTVRATFGSTPGTGSSGHTETGMTVATSTRYHLVITSSGTAVVGYLNGSAVFTDNAFTAGAANSNNGFKLFQYIGGDRQFLGYAQEFALYDKVLSAGRVAAHYAAGT